MKPRIPSPFKVRNRFRYAEMRSTPVKRRYSY